MFRTIQGRLFASYVLLVVALTLTVAIPMGVILTRAYLGTERAQLLRNVSDLTRVIAETGPVQGALQSGVLRLAGRFSAASVLLLDRSGHVVSAWHETGHPETRQFPQAMIADVLRSNQAEARVLGLGTSGAVLVAMGPLPRSAGLEAAVIVLYRPVRELRVARWLTLVPFWRAGVVGLVLALLLAFWLSRGIAEPLRRITLAARELAQGRTPAKTAPGTNDELGQLGRAFDDMAVHIRDLLGGLAKERDRVRDLEATRRDLISNVSHELRTPVTSILGYLEALRDGLAPSEEERQRYLGIIEDEAQRLSRLVQDLFDLSKLESGQAGLRMVPLDLASLAREVARKVAIVAATGGVGLEVLAPDTLSFVGDQDRLAQVLINLLDNAIRFTPSGGNVRLEVGAAEEADAVHLVVSDTGPGIAPEDLPHVFDRFYTGDKSRARPGGSWRTAGTGLGLAIVRQVVAAHGGTVSVTSAPGQGTTFVVKLPGSVASQ